MINGYSAEQIRAAEKPHLAAGEPLMQRAAAGLAEEIRTVLRQRAGRSSGRLGSILLLVGSGDNGGDGLFAGAELATEGVDVTVFPTGPRMHEGGLAAALAAGARISPVAPGDIAPVEAGHSGLPSGAAVNSDGDSNSQTAPFP